MECHRLLRLLLVALQLAVLPLARGQSLDRNSLTAAYASNELPMLSYECWDQGADHVDAGFQFCSSKKSKWRYIHRRPASPLKASAGPRAAAQMLLDDPTFLGQPLVQASSSYYLCDCSQWHKIAPVNDESIFAERNGHAVTVFNGKLWLVGGRSKEYKKWDLSNSYRRADVWYSYNGQWWIQEEKLFGDFYHQNSDVLIPGPVAPWWERFGHSLDTMQVMNRTRNGELDKNVIPEAMVLFGGYAPDPMNDLWISMNGNTWNKVFLPPNSDKFSENVMNTWPTPRAYHGSCIFQDALWIVGGTPLNNEVWRASNLTVTSVIPAGERVEAPRYFTVEWKSYFTRKGLGGTNIPFMPRAGLMMTSQKVHHFQIQAGQNFNPAIEGDDDLTIANSPNYPYTYPEYDHKGNLNISQEIEYLYIMGGFATWPGDDPRYDGGKRARNDVWRAGGPKAVTDDATDDGTTTTTTTTDEFGLEWTRLDILESDGEVAVTTEGYGGGVKGGPAGAPWAARAFGSLVTWNFESSPEWVTQNGESYPYHLSRTENLTANGVPCGEERAKGSRDCRTSQWLGTRESNNFQDVTYAAWVDSNMAYYCPKGWMGLYESRKNEMNSMIRAMGRVKTAAKRALRSRNAATMRKKWMRTEGMYTAPRMWLSGGAYLGTKVNQNVRTLEAYVDLWWSRDGIEWFQVSRVQSGDDSGYDGDRAKGRTGAPRATTLESSCEAYATVVDEEKIFLGKYGHTTIPFRPVGTDVPALFFIGGDTVDDGATVSDVFQSSNGIFCDVWNPHRYDMNAPILWENTPSWDQPEGVFETCSGHGTCGQILPVDRYRGGTFYTHQRTGKGRTRITESPADKATIWQEGCLCDNGFAGEYCEGQDPDEVAGAGTTAVHVLCIGVVLVFSAWTTFFA